MQLELFDSVLNIIITHINKVYLHIILKLSKTYEIVFFYIKFSSSFENTTVIIWIVVQSNYEKTHHKLQQKQNDRHLVGNFV